MTNAQIWDWIEKALRGFLYGLSGWFLSWGLTQNDYNLVVSAIIAAANAAWTIWSNRREAQIKRTDALPGVAGVILNDVKLANTIPSTTVVPQGSVAAKVLAAPGGNL